MKIRPLFSVTAVVALLSYSAFGTSPLVITVGRPDADIPGHDGRAIQIAIDAVAAQGGGAVQVAAGDYLLSDSLRMRKGVTVTGDRGRTKLYRGPLVWSRLAVDADKSEQQMVPAEPGIWREGMGVCMFDRQSKKWLMSNKPVTITGITNGVCRFHDYLADGDTIAEAGGLAVNHFPMILFDQADQAAIDGFEIDAAVADPQNIMSGLKCYAIYVWRSQNARLSNLIVRNAQNDGITTSSSSVGVLIEDCAVIDSGNFGIHPGSHSTDVIVRRCTIRGSASDGLWVCWGIRRGQFTDNLIINNGRKLYRSGICIGHKDTDVLFEGNRIIGNRKHGIDFRNETEANGAHRTVIRGNLIENNGSNAGDIAGVEIPPGELPCSGIAISPVHHDLVIEGNIIRETRSGAEACQRHAIVISKGSSVIRLKDNSISGHPETAVIDLNQEP